MCGAGKALVRALERFRREGPNLKRRLAVSLAMGMAPLWSLGFITREEAQVIVVVGCFVDDQEVPRVGARNGLVEGAQV